MLEGAEEAKQRMEDERDALRARLAALRRKSARGTCFFLTEDASAYQAFIVQRSECRGAVKDVKLLLPSFSGEETGWYQQISKGSFSAVSKISEMFSKSLEFIVEFAKCFET